MMKTKRRPVVHDITKLNKSIKATLENLANALFSVSHRTKYFFENRLGIQVCNFQNYTSLKNYNTFGIDVKAKYFVNIDSLQTLRYVLKENSIRPIYVLGGGSNVLLTRNLDQELVLYINNKGVEIVNEEKTHVDVEVQAGENWHQFVLWCLKNDFGGIENLALIPGKVGAAPIQNIGAYGVELEEVFVSCKTVDINTLEICTFDHKSCQFGYRDSIFKRKLKGKYIILSVRLRLSRSPHILNISYGSLKEELKDQELTIQRVAEAVISIRSRKLPDPEQIGNAGSFFQNPIISKDIFQKLIGQFPQIPNYIDPKGIKIAAGWLIENLGFKGYRLNDAGVHTNQALVLVNYGNAKGEEIYQLSRRIRNKVQEVYGIILHEEVQVI